MKPPIIDRPELLPRTERYGFAAITLFFWMIYMYLWLPLMGLVAWTIGLSIFYREMFASEGYQGMLELLGIYLIVIFLIAVILGSWAASNYFRFRGMDRRKAVNTVSIGDLSSFFHISTSDLLRMQKSKNLTISMNGDGKMVSIKETADLSMIGRWAV